MAALTRFRGQRLETPQSDETPLQAAAFQSESFDRPLRIQPYAFHLFDSGANARRHPFRYCISFCFAHPLQDCGSCSSLVEAFDGGRLFQLVSAEKEAAAFLSHQAPRKSLAQKKGTALKPAPESKEQEDEEVTRRRRIFSEGNYRCQR
jgi:hypothetical protein